MEYFLFPLSATFAAHIPFPPDLPLSKRADYMRKPPQSAIDAAERWPIAAPLPTPVSEVHDGDR